ncbi:MAG: hypothetical protein JOZ55_04100 [Alphaproteobacteria bacterium]|nr:hypothetical protein [Alphaproteobacteria bacterium]
MMDQPSMLELVDAVRAFLEQRAMPELKGHTAFHARVAANALGIVARELKNGPEAARAEMERLKALLGHEGTLEELNRELCAAIRDGRLGLETQGLAEHLERTVRDKVAIDQPGYSGMRQARER